MDGGMTPEGVKEHLKGIGIINAKKEYLFNILKRKNILR